MATGEVVPAGEGDGQVRETVKALAADGFDGFFSMEPHLGTAHHSRRILRTRQLHPRHQGVHRASSTRKESRTHEQHRHRSASPSSAPA